MSAEVLWHGEDSCQRSHLKPFVRGHDDWTSGVFGRHISLNHQTMIGEGFGDQMR